MKILFATSECAPFSKSGGLADVAYSLPPALKAAGSEIAVITPLYRCVREKHLSSLIRVLETTVRVGWREKACCLWRGEMNGVTVWFVDNADFFDRPALYGYDDDKLRFAWFSRAVVDLLFSLDFVPEILHCNDWETAPAVLYLKNDQMLQERLRRIKTVYTIHNIAYQGQFGARELQDTFGLSLGWYDGGLAYEYQGRHDINLMKGAMLMADAVSTVSATYARELHRPEFGAGLEGTVELIKGKLHGILNGLDMKLYDPSGDPRIPARFTSTDLRGKARCKRVLQQKFGLACENSWPLLVSVARLVEQKGVDLIRDILPDLMGMGVQVIIYGQGDKKYTDEFELCRQRWPEQFGFSSDFDDDTASMVFAGADFYLMPSRFEPCGLSQMMAMRYGTVPIVHETGGLRDSVRPYRDLDGVGDGFSFSPCTAHELKLAIRQALKVYFADPDTFRLLRRRCMKKDFSWERSALLYNQMYASVSDEPNVGAVSFEEGFECLSAAYRQLYADSRRTRRLSPERHTLEITMKGRCSGTFGMTVEKGGIELCPRDIPGADARISAGYDHLLGMALGQEDFDALYLQGQVRVRGNLSKAMELKPLLSCPGRKESRSK